MAALFAIACGGDDDGGDDVTAVTDPALDVQLTSPDLAEGGTFAADLTCDGADSSPALSWSGIPANAGSLALIMDDVSARFTHWVAFNIPVNAGGLPAGAPQGETLANGATQGTNDFGVTGYGGPCPPAGDTHTYRFRLYVLSSPLSAASSVTGPALLDAMTGVVMGWGELTALYSR